MYQVYFISLVAIYIIYALVFLGVFTSVPKYVLAWHTIVQLGLCLFLMFRYRPLQREYKFRKNDASLIFGAAGLLFVNIVVSVPILYSYIESTYGHLTNDSSISI
jgi:hypothetical protein